MFNIAVKEIAEQIGREAAARVIAAENRAAQADRMTKDTKEQAMAMIKRIQDSFQRRVRSTPWEPSTFRAGSQTGFMLQGVGDVAGSSWAVRAQRRIRHIFSCFSRLQQPSGCCLEPVLDSVN